MTTTLHRCLLLVCLLLGASAPALAQGDPRAGHVHVHEPPAVTDEDRAAAFPDVGEHGMGGNAVNYLVLVDRLEWQRNGAESGATLGSHGWVGFDRDRLWFRVDADAHHGRIAHAQAQVLYGRQFSQWWDVVAGVRQDVRPGPARTWGAIGVQGLAPYRFDVQATAYVGASWRTLVRFETKHDLLLTNRLVLQPIAEVEIAGKADPDRSADAGGGSADAGFRVRYEWRRDLAPYIGVAWRREWRSTAGVSGADGEGAGTRFVAGLRWWF